jgi:membrane fusion protein (multidrug efflux system)
LNKESGSSFSLPVARRAPLKAPLIEPPSVSQANASVTVATAKRHRRAWRGLIASAALLVFGSAGWYGHHWWTVGRFIVSTDDAYVGADNTTLAAKISGHLSGVLVENNAHVRAGDVIVTIDDGDYRLAVEAATGTVATHASVPLPVIEQAVGSQTLAPLLREVMPAVVSISVRAHAVRENSSTAQHRRDGRRSSDIAFDRTGSGVVFDGGRGFIVTNNHVIDRAESIKVTLADGRTLSATLVGADPRSNLIG